MVNRLQKRFSTKNPTEKGQPYMRQLVKILFRRDSFMNCKDEGVINLFQQFPELKDQVCINQNVFYQTVV